MMLSRFRNTLALVFLLLLLGVILLPVVGLIFSAFKSSEEIAAGPLSPPHNLRWENFSRAWTTGRFGTYFRSSLIVAVGVVLPSLLLSALSGYAFGILGFMPGRRWLFALFLLGLMVPMEGVVIPLYHGLHQIGLTDHYPALILPQIGLSLSFGTFWMSNAFASAPQELIDAATLDGCSRWQLLWWILWPISQPAVLTLAVLLFMWTWNEFLLALVLVQDEALRTLPVGLAFFQGRYTADIPRLAAGALIVAGPIITLYLLFQRSFVRGLLNGAFQG